MANLLSFGKDVIGGGGSGGGHIIQNSSGVDLTQRDTLQFKGGLKATDDSTNEKTVVDGSPNEITWAEYNALTPSQQASLEHTLVTDVPGADGTISADLMTKLWENPNPTSAFASQNITLSSGDYDFLLCTFRRDDSSEDRFSAIVEKGYSFMLSCSWSDGAKGLVIRSRYITRSSDTVFTAQGGRISAGDNPASYADSNSGCIPTVIYGIKKTVTVTFDALAKNVSTLASNCMLSDGVTNVENAIDKLNAEFVVSKITNIMGGGVLTKYGHLRILDFPNATYNASGTPISVGDRPSSIVWSSVSSSAEGDFRMAVRTDGTVGVQQNGGDVQTANVRGQILWTI